MDAASDCIPMVLWFSSAQDADEPGGRALQEASGPRSGRPWLLMDHGNHGAGTHRLTVELGCESEVLPMSECRRALGTGCPELP